MLSVPRNSLKTSAIADVFVPWAPGYSGWLGVATSGCQPGSSTVAWVAVVEPRYWAEAVRRHRCRVDRGHRPPEEESVLGVEHRHQSVRAHRVDHGEQPRRLKQVERTGGREIASGDVELPDHVRCPETRDRTSAPSFEASYVRPAVRLDLVESPHPRLARKWRRRLAFETDQGSSAETVAPTLATASAGHVRDPITHQEPPRTVRSETPHSRAWALLLKRRRRTDRRHAPVARAKGDDAVRGRRSDTRSLSAFGGAAGSALARCVGAGSR